MEKFKFFEHTADTKYQAYGKNLEESFSNAAIAMFTVITDTKKIQPKINKKISVKGYDLKSLLYNYLEELLFLLDTQHYLLNHVKGLTINKKNKEYFLEATAVGDRFNKNYQTSGDIKAITYNEMDIKQEKDKVMVQIVLDL